MKLKRFGELDEVNVGDFPEDDSQDNQDAMQAFNDACENFDFYGAFVIAQEEGLFGGDFEDYIESRKTAGGGRDGAYGTLIKLHDEYEKIASKLKDLIISDMEQSQNDFGVPPTDGPSKYDHNENQ